MRSIMRMASMLSAGQLSMLVSMLEGRSVRIQVRGAPYVCRCEAGMYCMQSTAAGSVEHTVYKDLSACSCQDSKHRMRTCKHVEALQAWLEGRNA